MPFNSYPYLVFLILVVLGFLLLERRFPWARRVFLLLVSYGFYAWWRADFMLLVVGSTIVNYAMGGEITRRFALSKPARPLLLAGLIFNLGLIGMFKYAGLFVGTADGFSGWSLPSPISFCRWRFRSSPSSRSAIWWMRHAARRSVIRFSITPCSSAYFPHLIAGPIVRYNDLIPQFSASRTQRSATDDLPPGVTLFTIGWPRKR